MRAGPAFALALCLVASTAAGQDPPDGAVSASDSGADAPDVEAPAADSPDAEAEAEAEAEVEEPEGSAEPTVPPPPITFGPLESLDLAQGISVTVQAPSEWTAVDGDVMVPDLDQVPGAQVKISRSWTPSGKRHGGIVLVCVSAPASDWTRGLESLVFERMNGMAKEELARGMTVGSFEPGIIESTSFGYQQDFNATGESGTGSRRGGVRVLEAEDGTRRRGPRMTMTGRHSLAFSSKEPEPQVLTCSLACVEPTYRAGAICGTALGTHRIVGETGPEPVPTIRARFLLGFSRRPVALAGVAAGLLSLLVGVVAVVRGLLLPSRA